MQELSTWTNYELVHGKCYDTKSLPWYLPLGPERASAHQPSVLSSAFVTKTFWKLLNRHWVQWLVWLDWQLSIWWLGQAFPTPVHSIRYTSGKSHSKRLASLRVTPQSLANSCTRGNIDVSRVFPYLSFDISQHSLRRHKEAINPSTSHHGATGSKSKSLVRLVLKRCNRSGKNWTSIGDHRCITIDG